MKNLIFKMLSLVVLATLSISAHSSWSLSDQARMKLRCTNESFERGEIRAWKNGKNEFLLCSFRLPSPEERLLVSDSYQIRTLIGGRVLDIADEPESGAVPRRVDVEKDVISITTTMGEKLQFDLTKRVISCRKGKCEFGRELCVLKASKNRKLLTQKLAKKLQVKAADSRKIWASYFFGGENVGDGHKIMVEAMLGDPVAAELLERDIGADGGVRTAQLILQEEVRRVRRICLR